ncbi:MAG: hypothetical protein JSR37_07910 [Verrucomicrobia bacterium]|nr:hypothetical protein [Verrucomicrobiota bacterium]MBS0637494.1 hypothetical protein [Verrucomicrobiota bacterium]
MKYIVLLLLLSLQGHAIEVHTTNPPAHHSASDQQHYSLFAKRFSDMLMTHRPVSDCHVLVNSNSLHISIEINRPALIAFLTEELKIRFVSQKDQDRYLDSFRTNIHNAASEIFTEIAREAIHITLELKDDFR